MSESAKRKASPTQTPDESNKEKVKKRTWQTPGRQFAKQGAQIQVGDAGIWATCDKGRESKCIGELRDLFQEYAEKLYGNEDPPAKQAESERHGDEEADIEAEIQDEVQSMSKSAGKNLFTHVRVDVQCVLFFKTKAPVDPVQLVHTICRDALQTGRKRTRAVRRLTPVVEIGKATEAGLEELAKKVLAPYFHTGDGVQKTFAIRPTLRNHGDKILSRDSIIKKVAEIVGPDHKVDLGKPQLTIMVEVYKFFVGLCVVGSDFDELKRFNLAEILYPSGDKGNRLKAPAKRPKPSESETRPSGNDETSTSEVPSVPSEAT